MVVESKVGSETVRAVERSLQGFLHRQAQESRLREKQRGRAVPGSPEVCELAGRVTYRRRTGRNGNGTVPIRLMAL